MDQKNALEYIKKRVLKRNFYSTIIFFFLFFHSTLYANERIKNAPQNFVEAKLIAKAIWNGNRKTFYCQCPYDKHGIVHFEGCSYKTKQGRKAKRISWEHIVPVSWYGQSLSCWKNFECTSKGKKFKGRNCCQQNSETFRKMEADLHNLVPALKTINYARKNYHFTEFDIENRKKHYYHQCQIIIDERYRLIEPDDRIKGTIARIVLYISEKYKISLTKREKILMQKWHTKFPTTEWERIRNQKIKSIQGDSNYYIEREN